MDICDSLTMAFYLGHRELRILPCPLLFHFYFYCFTMNPTKLRHSLPRMNFKYLNVCFKIANGEDMSKSRQNINVFTFYDYN